MEAKESLFSDGRPWLLDLFCGAGGASVGYHRAGFAVVGVDISPQPHYPFTLMLDDALAVLRTIIGNGDSGWAAIHASPPCQRYSDLAKRNGNASDHPDLIAPLRELLELTGLPYVIENVEGAPLIDPIRLCATERGLGYAGYRLRRHRLFEANFPLVSPGCWCHSDPRPVMDVSGGGPSHAPRLDGAGGRTYKGTADEAREAMGIPWMTKAELNEAIPPAFTQIIGPQVLAAVQRALVGVEAA